MLLVCGNISTGVIHVITYFALSCFRSRASVAGSQDMYAMSEGARSAIFLITPGLRPARGGSTTSASGAGILPAAIKAAKSVFRTSRHMNSQSCSPPDKASPRLIFADATASGTTSIPRSFCPGETSERPIEPAPQRSEEHTSELQSPDHL